MRMPKQSIGGGGTVFFLTPEARAARWDVSFVTDAGDTKIKPYPFFEGGLPLPQIRDGSEDLSPEERIGDFVAVYQIIVQSGKNKISGIAETCDELEGCGNLYRQFYNNLVTFSKRPIRGMEAWEQEAFSDLQEFTKGNRPMLGRVQQALFIKGAMFQLNGEGALDEDSQPGYKYKQILRLPISAFRDMKDKLLTPLDPNEAFSVDNSLLGNITDPENGAYITISCREIHLKDQNIDQNRYFIDRGEAPADPKNPTRSGDEAILPMDTDTIFKDYLNHGRFNDWDNLIARPTNTELSQMLAMTFTPALVWIGLSETGYRDSLPDSVRGDVAEIAAPAAATPPPAAKPAGVAARPATAPSPRPPVPSAPVQKAAAVPPTMQKAMTKATLPPYAPKGVPPAAPRPTAPAPVAAPQRRPAAPPPATTGRPPVAPKPVGMPPPRAAARPIGIPPPPVASEPEEENEELSLGNLQNKLANAQRRYNETGGAALDAETAVDEPTEGEQD